MNRYFDFESDVEKIDIQINKLNSNDNNYNNQKTKLLEKKIFYLKKYILIYQHGKKFKLQGMLTGRML